jgi:Bacterial Ig-like domain (group 2)
MKHRAIFGFGIPPRRLRTARAVVMVCVMPLLGSCSGSDSGTTTTAPGNDTVTQAVGAGGGTVVTPSGAAGVQIPAGTFSQQVMVTITRLPTPSSPGAGPLPSSLKQYGPYYDFTTSPQVAQFGDSARVGVCQVTDPSSRFYPPEPHDRLRLAHTVGNSIEILDRVGVNDFLRCTNVSASRTTRTDRNGWAAALLAIRDAAIGLMRPANLYAAHGGLGGKVKSFSPFGAVDPAVATVTVTLASPSVTVGNSVQASAVLKDADGNVLTNRLVAWTSSNAAVATVSATGVVTGVAAGGPVTITATSEGQSGTAAINVQSTTLVWSSVSSGTTSHLFSVWGTSASDVWAVGDNGTILHYNGTTWSNVSSGVTQPRYGVWGTSASDVWAVGGVVGIGTILHYNGTTWSSASSASSGATQALFGVWGTSASDVWAVGGAGSIGTILHYNGTSWSSVSSGTTEQLILFGVWGTSASDVWAVGVGGTILHYNGTTWSSVSSGATQAHGGVWGTSASDVWAVGETILHYNGTSWSSVSSGTIQFFHSVWGTSASDVWAVGLGGTILHYNGTTWSSVSSGTAQELVGVWGSSSSNVWAVGYNGTILHGSPAP